MKKIISFGILIILVLLLGGCNDLITGLAKGGCRPQPYECSDCVDNDGDRKIDYRVNKKGVVIGDPDCTSVTDICEHPASTEVCDGNDNDCDGSIDEACLKGELTLSTLKDFYTINELVKLTDPPNIVGSSSQSKIKSSNLVFKQMPSIDNLPKSRGYIVKLKEKPILEKKAELDNKVKRKIISENEALQELNKHKTVILNQQKLAKKEFNKIITQLNIKREYQNVLNGFSIDVSEQDIKRIKQLVFVEQVYPNLQVNATLMDSVPLINADDVWNMGYSGMGTTIAIIDTGVDYTHPDLGGCFGTLCKVIGGYDFVNSDTNPMDDHGHGTHVAATSAGNGALKGVAPDAKIYAYKVLDSRGYGYFDDIVSAIERAVDPNQDYDTSDHVSVISMSLGADCFFYTEHCGPDDPLSQAVDTAVKNGVIAVIAAGNSGPTAQTIGTPGTSRKAITVGATNKNDILADFSSRGPLLSYGINLKKPDLVAPGVGICAAQWDSAWSNYQCFDTKHIAISGTSMATPHVAGAAAILKQKNPTWTPDEIKQALKNTALSLPYSQDEVGKGRLDILSAVGSSIPDVVELNTYGKVNGIINLQGTASSNNFQSYTLKYGEGINPIAWTELFTSTSQVSNGILYEKFDTTLFNDGIITLDLIMYTSQGGSSDNDYLIIDNVYISSPADNTVFSENTGIINIKGTARGTNFKNYEIKMGRGDQWSTTGVTLLNNGNSQVVDGILGTLNIGEIVNTFGGGMYKLKLIVYHINSIVKEEFISFGITKYLPGWPQPVAGVISSSPSIGDIDNNGDLEVVIGGGYDNNNVYAFNHDGTLVNGWPKTTGGGISSPVLADIDGNGDLEIFFGSYDGKMYAWHHDGRVVNGWPYQTSYKVSADKATLTSTSGTCPGSCNNGACELVIFQKNGCTDSDGNLNYFLKGTANDGITSGTDYCDGNILNEYICRMDTYKVMVKIYKCPYGCNNGACNNNEGAQPVYSCTDTDGGDNQFVKGTTYCDNCKSNVGGTGPYEDYCTSGTQYVEYHCDISYVTENTYHGSISSPSIGDVDGDGDLEIVFGLRDIMPLQPQPDGREGSNHFYVLNHDGTLLSGWPKSLKSLKPLVDMSIYATPSLADLDNNGDLEIVIGTSFYHYVWNHDGTLFDGNNDGIADWPRQICLKDLCGNGFRRTRTSVVGDVDNDGDLEIVTFADPHREDSPDGRYSSIAHVFNKDGTELPGFPLELPDMASYVEYPVLMDIGADGYLEIVAEVNTGGGEDYGSDMIIIGYDGSYVWPKGFVELIDEKGLKYGNRGAAVVDLDGDGNMEIVIAAGYYMPFVGAEVNEGRVFAWHHDGTQVSGFPKILPSAAEDSILSVNDINQDGGIDVVGGSIGYVYALSLLGTYNPNRVEWAMFSHDIRHTNLYDFKGTEPRIKSQIKDTGTIDITGYLLMKVQKYLGSWQDVKIVVDETTPRTVLAGQNLALDTIWQDAGAYTTTEQGTFRVYVAFRDSSGRVIQTDKGFLENFYEFRVI